MSDFAVLHITKYKQLAAIGRHIDRKQIAPNVDRDKSAFNEELTQILGSKIDPHKTHLKEEMSQYQDLSLNQAVELRIQQGYTRDKAIRKDAVKALGIILTGSHERMKEIENNPELFQVWKNKNYDFCCKAFGKENIVRFTLHRDEKTPHFHCVVVPITTQGALSAKYFIGSADKLKAYQDQYAHAMKEFGLQRGIPKAITKRIHIPTKEYYKNVNLIEQKTQEITQQIHLKNAYKLDKIRKNTTEHITQLQVQLVEKSIQLKYAQETNHTMTDSRKEDACKNIFQQEAQRDYHALKQNINLIEFAIGRLGWSIDKNKSSKKDTVLKHPQHGKIIAPTKPKQQTGQWVFSWVDRDGGGTIIDLLLEHQWTWKDIRNLAHTQNYQHSIHPTSVPKPVKKAIQPKIAANTKEVAQKRFNNFNSSPSPTNQSYLNQRGIQADTYKNCQQLKTNRHNAIFALYNNVDKDYQAKICSTINYYLDRDGKTRKYFQKDLPRGIAMIGNTKSPKNITITESPIDALSLKQLQKNNDTTLYIATCGNLTTNIKKELRQICSNAQSNNQKITIAFDNDVPGQKMTQQLASIFHQEHYPYIIDTPLNVKDWNEVLTKPQVPINRAALHKIISIDQKVIQAFNIQQQEDQHSITIPAYNYVQDKIPTNDINIALNDHGGIAISHPTHISILKPQQVTQNIIITEDPISALQQHQKIYQELLLAQKRYLKSGKTAYLKSSEFKTTLNKQEEQQWQEAAQEHKIAKEKLQHLEVQFNSTMYIVTYGDTSRKTQLTIAQIVDQSQQKQQSVTVRLTNSSVTAFDNVLQQRQGLYNAQETPPHSFINLLTQNIGNLKKIESTQGYDYEEDEEQKAKQQKKAGQRYHLRL